LFNAWAKRIRGIPAMQIVPHNNEQVFPQRRYQCGVAAAEQNNPEGHVRRDQAATGLRKAVRTSFAREMAAATRRHCKMLRKRLEREDY
jgi:hypothetical protein